MHDTGPVFTPRAQAWALLTLLRPRHWVKNAFVLAPLLFTAEFVNSDSVARAVFAALLFCVAASASYVINDLRDIEADRRHPSKAVTRPLAAGSVKPRAAVTAVVALYVILVAAWFVHPAVAEIVAAYVVLNVAYTFALKHQPVIDIFSIAMGFVLRVYAGAIAISVPVSGWMFITTLCLALYLAALKRRQELKQSGTEGRQVLVKYSAALVDRYAEMSGTGALVFYSLFVMSSRPQMLVTVPLVLFGLFRYWYVVEALDAGESPTDALLADWQLLVTVAAWAGACMWTLWPR